MTAFAVRWRALTAYLGGTRPHRTTPVQHRTPRRHARGRAGGRTRRSRKAALEASHPDSPRQRCGPHRARSRRIFNVDVGTAIKSLPVCG